MASKAIYLMAGEKPDEAIEKGLIEAGCTIELLRSVSATIAAMQAAQESDADHITLLVAEVQAGGIPLLALMQEQKIQVEGILVYDRDGTDIHTVIKALKYGASDYLLAGDPDFQRQIRARILAERAAVQPKESRRRSDEPTASDGRPAASILVAESGFRWDPAVHIVYSGNSYLRLSPIEGRLFDLLLTKRNRMVTMAELIAAAFKEQEIDFERGIKLLRPHMMRLRNKLQRFPELARRIVNLRGSGYMFV
ncbi:MAG: winged helix-turn-helix domain-containing protein [Anaerolineae bacterium]|nr:winged helix-turn-helix domain-containing protein [Thermoflexales bacterium]MDW8406257.1 winged helix-turn-helix domain-containing protein [Anaerolineae bacterium]